MRSLLVTSTFPPRTGGRERYLYNVFSRFPSEDVVVVTWDREGNWQAFDQQSPFRIIRVDQTEVFWYFRGRRGRLRWFLFLGWLCLREKIDVVHCGMAIPDGMSGWLLERILGRPYVVYTYAKEILRHQDQRYLQQVLREAHRIITISKYTKQKLLELGVDPSKMEMVYPGVDLEYFRPDPAAGQAIRARHGISEWRPMLLTVARLTPGSKYVLRKGHDKVIEALPDILEQVPGVVYVIVGTGPAEGRLRAYVQEKDVADQVVFAGHVPDQDLPAYYNAADVFIMPNREEGANVEGFGIVFLEANACGRPVIGGRSGGAVDAIADGESGYLVDPDDTSAIAQATIRLLTDPSLAEEMGKAGRERARREFSWDRAARQVYALNDKVASETIGGRVALAHPARLARSCRFFLQRL